MTIGWIALIFVVLACLVLMPLQSITLLIVAFALPWLVVNAKETAVKMTAFIAHVAGGFLIYWMLMNIHVEDSEVKILFALLCPAALILGWGLAVN